jgi:hypothetical protein
MLVVRQVPVRMKPLRGATDLSCHQGDRQNPVSRPEFHLAQPSLERPDLDGSGRYWQFCDWHLGSARVRSASVTRGTNDWHARILPSRESAGSVRECLLWSSRDD